MTKTAETKKLLEKINLFVSRRKWQRYHSPKNLAMALSVEVAELVEIFQWKTQEESRELDPKTKAHVEEEIGDIMIYLTTLAAKFEIDPFEAAEKKMIKNEKKYPAGEIIFK